MTSSEKPIVLLTGTGFLGTAIIQEILEDTSPIKPSELRIFDLNPPENKRDHESIMIKYFKGDVRDYNIVNPIMKGVDIVIHTAAIVDWGTHPREEVYDVNVGGTKNLIKCAIENQVKAFVFTSSLDAIYRPYSQRDVDESSSYPDKHANMYCESKHISELDVIAANGEHLKTCVIRPSDIYGEADPYHIAPLVDMAKSGFYIRLGDGKAKCQHTYKNNCAIAHLMAGNSLLTGNSKVYGQVYLITDAPGTNFFVFYTRIIADAGYKIWPKNFSLPSWFAYTIGFITEMGALLLRPCKKTNPQFSRFAVDYTCNDFTFTSQKAKNEFGFEPKYTEKECVAMTTDYYRSRRKK